MDIHDKVCAAIQNCLGTTCKNLSSANHNIDIFDQDEKRIFSSQVFEDTPDDIPYIQNFDIFTPYTGKDLAKAAIKEILQALHDRNHKIVELHSVRHDGLTFWPHMGAFPPDVNDLSGHGLSIFSDREDIPEAEAVKLRHLSEVAKLDPEKAWFLLTDRNGEYGVEKQILEELNSSWSGEKIMFFDLTNPVVKKRLGLVSGSLLVQEDDPHIIVPAI